MISIFCYHNDDNNSRFHHKHKTEINGDKQEEKIEKKYNKKTKRKEEEEEVKEGN